MNHLSNGLAVRPIGSNPAQWQPFLCDLAACFRWEGYPPEVFCQKIWDDPDFDPNLCLLVGEPPGWKAFAMGVLRHREAEKPTGFIKMIAVTREHRGYGIGYELVRELERRLFDAGSVCIRVGESAPNYLTPGLDPRYSRAWSLFEGLGYRSIGHTFNLKVDLHSRQVMQRSSDGPGGGGTIEFRRAESSDRTRVGDLLQRYWPAWCLEVGQAFKRNPISLHLAFEGGVLLGFAGFDLNNRGTGWFGPMGTTPFAQGRGIGVRLLLDVLADIRQQGHREAIIPWVGPVGFYQKAVGARIDRVFIRLQKDCNDAIPEDPGTKKAGQKVL